jgi:BlaI family transcriptional regulator, penicillinase repressor
LLFIAPDLRTVSMARHSSGRRAGAVIAAKPADRRMASHRTRAYDGAMSRPAPTAAELAILRVLWRAGPSTVRDVHDAVYADTGAGYTSALKLMQNMLAKGLLTRADDARQHVYAAAVSERPTLNRLVGGWIDSAFSGSSLALAMQALDARPVAADELAQLKALIARMEAASKTKKGAA